MRKTVDIVGIASIVSFLLGWVSSAIWLNAGDNQPEPRAETPSVAVQTVDVVKDMGTKPSVRLLVAGKNLDVGTYFRSRPGFFIEEKEFLKENAPSGALKAEDLPKLEGKMLKMKIRKGDCITLGDITDIPVFPPGMRAVGLALDFDLPDDCYRPGSRVDIIWVGKAEGGNIPTKIIVQDAIVLEVGCGLPQQNDPPQPQRCMITVGVMPDAQLVLMEAMETGRLTIIQHQDKAKTPEGKAGKD